MLISGRTFQSLRTAGLYVLFEISICDIVPPGHREPYVSVVLSTTALGPTTSPIMGGALV